METNIFPASKQELKSYWNRPGGKFGVVAGIGILSAIGYFVVPILTSIVWNTLNFGIALGCLGIFLYAVTHRKLRLSLFYFYSSESLIALYSILYFYLFLNKLLFTR